MANIERYFPPAVAETKQFQEIAKAENPELDRLKENLTNIFSDTFVSRATANGVQRWEKILDIAPKGTDSLLSRKYRILARLGETPPYTYSYLIQYMNSVCGEGNYSMELKHLEYKLITRIFSNKVKAESKLLSVVKEAFRRMMPTNMIVDTKYQYNTERAEVAIAAVQKRGICICISSYEPTGYQDQGMLSIGTNVKLGIYIEVKAREE